MAAALPRARFDVVLDWIGASFPAACAGYAAMQLGPLAGAPALPTAIGASATLFIIAFAFMRTIPASDPTFFIPPWAVPGEPEGELLLEQRWQGVADELDELLLDSPLVEKRSAEVAELLLDDALCAPSSRVVQLFAPDQLRQRIDRHLANARSVQHVDASDALSEALAELKRSLNRA